MKMIEYSTLFRSPELEPHYQMWYPRHLNCICICFYFFQENVLFSKLLDTWMRHLNIFCPSSLVSMLVFILFIIASANVMMIAMMMMQEGTAQEVNYYFPKGSLLLNVMIMMMIQEGTTQEVNKYFPKDSFVFNTPESASQTIFNHASPSTFHSL